MLEVGYGELKYSYSCVLQANEFIASVNELQTICGKFKHLFSLLFSDDWPYSSSDIQKANFLNFWLNKELKKYNNAAVYANNFYNRIKSNYDWSNEANKLKDKIYNISEVHLRNMTTLYDLYGYYHKIITIIDSPNENECWNYSETCVQKYEEANQNCYRNTSKFCDALKSFNEKYQTIGEQPSLKCKIKTISLLPAYGEQSSEADISLEKSKQIMEVTQSQQISYSAGSVKTICVVIVTLFSIFFISLIFYKVNKNPI